MAWISLIAAGLLEVVWALALKRSEGFSKLPETVAFVVALVASMALLALALRSLPVGTGYAVWTGIGAVGTAIVGIAFLGESAAALRLVSIALIAAGIVGLALASPAGS
ncbi:quaternary ammonium compound efflux SMR transporter SugE [Patulibacter sp.]|uniref:quaternary ammonium compound efflux SMR transporter SugE n=1 Tax=Patulibacter sp. TaxID=1912859 RepID=UPI00271C1E84|nr:quaternary ammonium compound efflux SMR transporter SugE [Patulibacter sp.]MDO9409578.1 quaternary ammonium compound efflux SMR transporter SugE [Patulibacter sp.]